MKPTPTKTLNPLPFQDLEAHRFEDLIRQLAYDLRRWKSLEATGRSGGDEGIDIRGTEIVPLDEEPDEDEQRDPPAFRERLWIFQCKREKTFAPKQVRDAVTESLRSLSSPPHGFVLAICCDVSKRTRDAFRDEMVARGIEEFAIWARGELEDMLFQPKNDRLLFAYFGLALQPRRRSLSTELRAEIAKKKQLLTLIGEDGGREGKLVLVRDPTDSRYPKEPGSGGEKKRWLLCRAITVREPGHLRVLLRRYLAAVTPDRKRWDAYTAYDTMTGLAEMELQNEHAWSVDEVRKGYPRPTEFWNEFIADDDRAYLSVFRSIPLDRLLAIDPNGDGYYPIPHLLVEFDGTRGPFSPGSFSVLEFPGGYGPRRIDIDPTKENRADIFPKELPSSDDRPPKGFDDTLDDVQSLSTSTEQTLRQLLANMRREADTKTASPSSEPSSDGSSRKRAAFIDWCTRIAQPAFSAFVTRLRAEGHAARVVMRATNEPSFDAESFISLRMILNPGGQGYRFYRSSGHVKIGCTPYGAEWRTDMSPSPQDSRSAPRDSPSITEKTTREQLEAEVLALLKRLGGNS